MARAHWETGDYLKVAGSCSNRLRGAWHNTGASEGAFHCVILGLRHRSGNQSPASNEAIAPDGGGNPKHLNPQSHAPSGLQACTCINERTFKRARTGRFIIVDGNDGVFRFGRWRPIVLEIIGR
jgi:hypothetical protein